MTYQIYIYKIFWDDCEEFYIGSTKMMLCKRMGNHRTDCRKGKQFKLYNFMREKGLNSFQYVLISTHNVCSKDEQRKYEQRLIDELKPTLNERRAFITEEGRKERQKEYDKKNREQIKQRKKEPMQCECGAVLRKSGKSQHLRTEKHQFYESIYNFIYS